MGGFAAFRDAESLKRHVFNLRPDGLNPCVSSNSNKTIICITGRDHELISDNNVASHFSQAMINAVDSIHHLDSTVVINDIAGKLYAYVCTRLMDITFKQNYNSVSGILKVFYFQEVENGEEKS